MPIKTVARAIITISRMAIDRAAPNLPRASRVTAGAFGFLTFGQRGERPRR